MNHLVDHDLKPCCTTRLTARFTTRPLAHRGQACDVASQHRQILVLIERISQPARQGCDKALFIRKVVAGCHGLARRLAALAHRHCDALPHDPGQVPGRRDVINDPTLWPCLLLHCALKPLHHQGGNRARPECHALIAKQHARHVRLAHTLTIAPHTGPATITHPIVLHSRKHSLQLLRYIQALLNLQGQIVRQSGLRLQRLNSLLTT